MAVDYEEARIVDGIKMIVKADVDDVVLHASALPRMRAPIRIHQNFDEVPQRFVNCLNSGTYIRPHMHVAPDQWELMCWLSGEIVTLFFDDEGRVTHRILINEKNVRIIEIPPFCYHTIIALEQGAYLEIRNCKYNPSVDRAYASWSPAEASISAEAYQKRLCTAKIGDLVIC